MYIIIRLIKKAMRNEKLNFSHCLRKINQCMMIFLGPSRRLGGRESPGGGNQLALPLDTGRRGKY